MGGVTPDWLAQLAPPHAPAPPGWWPLAIGWWVLLILLVVTGALIIYWQTRPSVRLRRIALRELKNLQTSADDDIALSRDLEHLLRRYAVARFGRDTVANLSGERWIAFVVAHGGTAWSGATGGNLLRIAYGGAATADRAAWLSGAQAFIRGRA
jgi:hypothetical protein